MAYTEVADTLDAFVEGTGGPWDWDGYLSTFFADPYLAHVQQRMTHLSDEFPAERGQGGYCNADGIQVILGYVTELRNKAVHSDSGA